MTGNFIAHTVKAYTVQATSVSLPRMRRLFFICVCLFVCLSVTIIQKHFGWIPDEFSRQWPAYWRQTVDQFAQTCFVVVDVSVLWQTWCWIVETSKPQGISYLLFVSVIWKTHGCVLRWRHLVNACEVKAHLIGYWQYFGAVCFWQPVPSGLNLVVAAVLTKCAHLRVLLP